MQLQITSSVQSFPLIYLDYKGTQKSNVEDLRICENDSHIVRDLSLEKESL